MRISDWSSDVCSSDLCLVPVGCGQSLVPCLGETQAYKLRVGDKPRVEGLPLFLGGRQEGAHDRAARLDDVFGLGLVLGLRLGRQEFLEARDLSSGPLAGCGVREDPNGTTSCRARLV